MTEEAVSIAIPDDDAAIVKTTGAEEGAVVIAKTPAAKVETPPELADMKRQLEEAKAREATERTGRTEAERVAREQAEARGRAETQVADSRVASVTSAIEAEEAKASNAERAFAEAMAAGDFGAASKAQRQISDASARLVHLGTTKADLEASPKREPTHEGAVRPVPRTESDPVEAMASRVSAASAAWIRANPDVVKRPNALTAAHYQALDEGLRTDTPEYFAAVEKHLGIGVSKVDADDPPRQDAPRRQAVTTSAPVGAAGATTRASQSNVVTLSPNERDMARALYPDVTPAEAEKQYATNKLALIREGKLSA